MLLLLKTAFRIVNMETFKDILLSIKKQCGLARWTVAVIPALWRLSQEDGKVKASLNYIESRSSYRRDLVVKNK